MELTEEVTKLLNYAYRYLSYRMRTEKEMKDYLLQKADKKRIPSSVVDNVMSILKEEGYINDQQFIEEFIRARSKSKPKSIFALSLELRQKGINLEFIESYFQKNSLDEYGLASKALQKKWPQYQSYSSEIRFKKSADFLRRRGFSFAVIKKTIEEFESRE